MEYLKTARVARLATVGSHNSVSIVPFVFAIHGGRIYFVIDRKKKTGAKLKRIRNISENGKAVLLVDRFSENWEDLSYLLLHCTAKLLSPNKAKNEKRLATKSLKSKYPQYRGQRYFPKDIDQAIFVRLEPERAFFWQNLRLSLV